MVLGVIIIAGRWVVARAVAVVEFFVVVFVVIGFAGFVRVVFVIIIIAVLLLLFLSHLLLV